MNRRKVLGLLGAVPVVGPSLAAKLQHETKSAGLAAIQTNGLSYGSSGGVPPAEMGEFTPLALQQKRLAMQLPWVRSAVEEALREQCHYVGALDPDLAILKSVSLSAKICYQRQRNIERAINSYGREQPWMKLQSLWHKISGIIP